MSRFKPYPDVFEGIDLHNLEKVKFNMPEMRHYIPKMIQYIWEERRPKGDSTRGTMMYNRPKDLPENCPFVDPNNIDKLEGTNKKPTVEKIKPMFLELLKRDMKKRLSQPVVTESPNERCGDNDVMNPSGNLDENPRSVQSEIECPASVQSVNLSSPMGRLGVSEAQEDRGYMNSNPFCFTPVGLVVNKYNHQKVAKECDRVIECLHKIEAEGTGIEKVQLLKETLNNYKNIGKENPEQWDLLCEIRDFTDEYEIKGMISQVSLDYLYDKCQDQNLLQLLKQDNPDELIQMFGNENLDALGIQQREDGQVEEEETLLKDDPMLSSTTMPPLAGSDNLIEDDGTGTIEFPVEDVLDMETQYNVSSTLFVTSDRIARMAENILVPAQSFEIEVTSNHQSPSKRKRQIGSYIPSKVQKRATSDSSVGTSRGMENGGKPEHDAEFDSGTVNIPNIPLLQEKVSV